MFRFDWDLVARIRKLFASWRPAKPPEDDPLTAVRQPAWRTPGGRTSGISVPEPEPEEFVMARARSGRF